MTEKRSIAGQKPRRKAISAQVRLDLFRRDNFQCRYCGRAPGDGVKLVVDHVVPFSAGGTDDPTNLVTSCHACNAGKSDSLLDDGSVPVPSGDDAERLRERLRHQREYVGLEIEQRALVEEQIGLFMQHWDANLDERHRPSRSTVEKYLGLIGLNLLVKAADIAASKDLRGVNLVRYFAGVCRGMLRDAQPHESELEERRRVMSEAKAKLDALLESGSDSPLKQAASLLVDHARAHYGTPLGAEIDRIYKLFSAAEDVIFDLAWNMRLASEAAEEEASFYRPEVG